MVVQMKAEGWIQMCALPVLLQHYDRTTRHSGARTNNLNLAFCTHMCMQRSTYVQNGLPCFSITTTTVVYPSYTTSFALGFFLETLACGSCNRKGLLTPVEQ